MHRLRQALLFSFVFLWGSWPPAASASPLIEPHLGGVVLVGPTSAHPSSVFWNPAALAQSQFRGGHLFFSGSGRLDLTTVERASIDPATGEPGAGRDFDPVEVSTLSPGGFFSAITDFSSERYRFGLSVYTPFSEVFPDGGDTLAYHVRGGSFRSQFATLTIAVRATGQLFFGAGFSVVHSQAD